MHIPENYLSPETCAVVGAAMIPVLVVSVKKVKEEISKEKLPLLGVGAAFSFLMMMFNIPLPGGTTGHAVGAVLVAIMLGPYSACLSVTVALVIQALLFGDGGVLAIGANCFNMAFIMPFAGYAVYKFIKDRTKSTAGEYVGIIVGAYLGLNIAALVAAVEFGVQPLLFTNDAGQALYCPYPLTVSVPAMLIPHLLLAGVVEAAFTTVIYTFIRRTSPGSIYDGEKRRTPVVYGLLAALICLVPLGLLAAGTAWGEWGADEIAGVQSSGRALGFVPQGMLDGFDFGAVMPDYSVAGLPEVPGYILSAICGVAIAVILFKLIASFKKDKSKYDNPRAQNA